MKIKSITYVKILIFILLAFVAIFLPNNFIDDFVKDMMIMISNKPLTLLAKIISTIFNDKLLLLLMIVLAVFLVYIKEIKKSIFLIASAGIGGVLLFVLKYSIKRVRPLPELHSGYSFPSGHSTFVVIFFLALLFVINKKNILAIVAKFVIVLVPISRVILGAHFVTDVIAGCILGSIVIDIVKVYYRDIYFILFTKEKLKYDEDKK